jgi:hypothetical protein
MQDGSNGSFHFEPASFHTLPVRGGGTAELYTVERDAPRAAREVRSERFVNPATSTPFADT